MWKIKIIYSSFPTIGIRLMYFYQSDLVHFLTGSESSITLKLPPASVYFSSCSLLSKRPRHHNKDFTQRDRVTCDSVHFVTGSESKNIKIGTLKLPPKRYLAHTPFYQSDLVHFVTGSNFDQVKMQKAVIKALPRKRIFKPMLASIKKTEAIIIKTFHKVIGSSVHFVTGSESKNIKIGTLKLPPKRYLTHTPFYQSNLVHFLTGSAWQRFLRVTGQNVKNKNNILKLFPQAVFINKDFSQSEPGQM